jgi:hypothetical protein
MQIRFNWVSGTRFVFGIHIRIEKIEKMALRKEKKFPRFEKLCYFLMYGLRRLLRDGEFFIEV